MAYVPSENNGNGNFVDAAELSNNNKKTEYTNLGYMSWEVVSESGQRLVDADGDPLMTSDSDIRLSNPADPKHDFYCQGLADLVHMAEQAGGKAPFYLKVEVKAAQKKKTKKERMTPEDFMKVVGLTKAA